MIGDAITAIHANPGRPWTVKRLADKCNLSRSAFSERFVRTVGQPPAAYISQVRLGEAADLIQYTTEAVGVIAREIGYDSEAAFSRAFSKRYGIPPTKWRNERGGSVRFPERGPSKDRDRRSGGSRPTWAASE